MLPQSRLRRYFQLTLQAVDRYEALHPEVDGWVRQRRLEMVKIQASRLAEALTDCLQTEGEHEQ